MNLAWGSEKAWQKKIFCQVPLLRALVQVRQATIATLFVNAVFG